ncbi:VQ motif-containing protein 4 [Brachypodium distachyon]|uniref:VQ domain-containing protein n=1 Tax=Brachypodium distachyon TaxID=15368 RepID=I1HHJ1_BRADI|nr:VQ motif-containing protein 4 [Brachypodium distachyon]KQK05352.1 hypothetical protein BRADI_2g19600v3 [Brachypodium distachyon]|eukprot:XP_003566032.1 VQ motif-containing protein 4 [Brachypodium distachyon]
MEVAPLNSKQLLLPMAPPRDPNSPSSSTSSSSPSSAAASPSSHHPPPPPSPSPRPAPRIIDTTPFPTTFVQADTASFKQIVQMLTGAADMPPPPPPSSQTQRPPAKTIHGGGVPCRAKKPAFKLYERRSGMKNLKMIAPLAMAAAAAAGASPRAAAPELLLSPSVLDFPSLALSPVTPLVPDPFNRSASGSPGEPQQQQGAMAEERAAIARKGFFLHPSPRSAAEPPRLLPLFPVTSPRMAAAAPSSEL